MALIAEYLRHQRRRPWSLSIQTKALKVTLIVRAIFKESGMWLASDRALSVSGYRLPSSASKQVAFLVDDGCGLLAYAGNATLADGRPTRELLAQAAAPFGEMPSGSLAPPKSLKVETVIDRLTSLLETECREWAEHGWHARSLAIVGAIWKRSWVEELFIACDSRGVTVRRDFGGNKLQVFGSGADAFAGAGELEGLLQDLPTAAAASSRSEEQFNDADEVTDLIAAAFKRASATVASVSDGFQISSIVFEPKPRMSIRSQWASTFAQPEEEMPSVCFNGFGDTAPMMDNYLRFSNASSVIDPFTGRRIMRASGRPVTSHHVVISLGSTKT